MKNRILSCAIISVSLASCTTYTENGFTGGFSDTQLAESVWEIRASGNGFASSQQVEEFVLLRSAEIALAEGYTHFIFLSEDSVVSTSYHSNYSLDGSYAGISSVSKPSAVSRVRFFRPGEVEHLSQYARQNVMDAEIVWSELSSKHLSDSQRLALQEQFPNFASGALSLESPSESQSTDHHDVAFMDVDVERRDGLITRCEVQIVRRPYPLIDSENYRTETETNERWMHAAFGVTFTDDTQPMLTANVGFPTTTDTREQNLQSGYLVAPASEHLQPGSAYRCGNGVCVELLSVERYESLLNAVEERMPVGIGWSPEGFDRDLYFEFDPSKPEHVYEVDLDLYDTCFQAIVQRYLNN